MGCNEAGLARFCEVESQPSRLAEPRRYPREANMSYDYLVWRRSPNAKTAMLKACSDATAEERSHAAMAPFDVDSFVNDLESEFGDVNNDPEGPFRYGVGTDNGVSWISLLVSYPRISDVNPCLCGSYSSTI